MVDDITKLVIKWLKLGSKKDHDKIDEHTKLTPLQWDILTLQHLGYTPKDFPGNKYLKDKYETETRGSKGHVTLSQHEIVDALPGVSHGMVKKQSRIIYRKLIQAMAQLGIPQDD